MFEQLKLFQSAQNWFAKTERSSGFRPYLIFLIIDIFFTLIVFIYVPQSDALKDLAILSLKVAFFSFVVLFAIKTIIDLNFCRSEKHIENVRKLELAQQKGDSAPTLIEGAKVVYPESKTPRLGNSIS